MKYCGHNICVDKQMNVLTNWQPEDIMSSPTLLVGWQRQKNLKGANPNKQSKNFDESLHHRRGEFFTGTMKCDTDQSGALQSAAAVALSCRYWGLNDAFRHIDLFQPFLHSLPVSNTQACRQTDRQTDRQTMLCVTSVPTGHIYALHVMRCNKMYLKEYHTRQQLHNSKTTTFLLICLIKRPSFKVSPGYTRSIKVNPWNLCSSFYRLDAL